MDKTHVLFTIGIVVAMFVTLIGLIAEITHKRQTFYS